MPFKSQAQRRKFGELVKQGKIKPEVFNEWNSSTPSHLPERLGGIKKPKTIEELRQIARKKLNK